MKITTFQKAQWVQIEWKGVYPKWKGQVLRQASEVTTVVFPRYGTIDLPTDKLKATNEPKRG